MDDVFRMHSWSITEEMERYAIKIGGDLRYKSCHDIIENKLTLILKCQKCWPMHASVEINVAL